MAHLTQRQQYIRARVLSGHVYDVAVKLPAESKQALFNFIDYGSAANSTIPGSLSIADVLALKTLPTLNSVKLDKTTQDLLSEALDQTLLSVAAAYTPQPGHGISEQVRFEQAWDLPDDISAHQERIKVLREHCSKQRKHIRRLVHEINQAHLELRRNLLEASKMFPSQLEGRRAAARDVLAAQIEESNTRLELQRARTHTALYQFPTKLSHGSSSKESRMPRALAGAEAHLLRSAEQRTEDCTAIDAQLKEYADVLALVGGDAYGQVVDDWTRVKRESEECRKDLRRLGWTGD